jgi:organic hydroperoxide reductase OsmC/OhrA
MADIAAAWHRVERVLRRNPHSGLQADVPATAMWSGGTRVACTHSGGTTVATDMPTEMGGDGTAVTPGWLLRAGLASCAATVIAMNAAVAGIRLATLEVIASSRSDTRGLLGMTDTDGKPVSPGPRNATPVELSIDARLAQILLAGLPQLVKVNVRGSSAGVWLESSVRYALAEARSPRPGGASVLAKLAEVLFIENLRLISHRQPPAAWRRNRTLRVRNTG